MELAARKQASWLGIEISTLPGMSAASFMCTAITISIHIVSLLCPGYDLPGSIMVFHQGSA
jgi:hypothetical protein